MNPNFLYLTAPLNGLLMIALPIGLGVFLSKRLGQRWSLFGIGALTFIASQVVHIPLLYGLTALFKLFPSPPDAWKLTINAVILGLMAGLCEETARYLIYRFWIKSARTWREGLMFGAGHGGVEAIIFGALALFSFIQLVALRNTDLSTLPLTPDQRVAAAQQVATFWATLPLLALVGALERVFALCLHLSLSVLVLQTFRRRNILWLGLAILWHAAVDGLAVYAAGTWGVYSAEVVALVFAGASLWIILRLNDGETPAQAASPASSGTPAPLASPAPTLKPAPEAKLDDSRFTE